MILGGSRHDPLDEAVVDMLDVLLANVLAEELTDVLEDVTDD